MAARSTRLAGPLIVAALVLASLGALILNQRARQEGLVLDRIHVSSSFSPNGDGHGDLAAIGFRIKGRDRVNLDVINASGVRLRRLAQDHKMRNRKPARFVWDGRTDAGSPAPPGVYTLRIEILGRGRTVTPSEEIVLTRPGPGK